jgi:phosphoribosyl 1,2-cyclic phosphodiesterase
MALTSPVFTITYWGVTGTFCDPMLPCEITDKIVNAIYCLHERGRLGHAQRGALTREAITQMLEEELPYHARSTYGGNTTCLEVQTPDSLLILDCGSGFRELGHSLDERWARAGAAAKRTANVLLTHSHIDHTFATPYFTPYYDPRNAFNIWGPQLALDSLTAVLDPKSTLSQVYFPPTYSEMKGIAGFRRLGPGDEIAIGSTRVTTMALNHPGGSMAYRFENSGKVFVFATDHEHAASPDPKLAEFARGADLLYADGQYTAAEYAGEAGIGTDRPHSHRGWGHSPVEYCVSTALAAGVRRLHVGHRDPRRDDALLADFEEYMRRVLREQVEQAGDGAECEVLIPYEGLQVRI